MTPALRRAATRAILMFHWMWTCEGQSHKSVHKPQPFLRERRAEAESNRRRSAYQPNTLPNWVTGCFDSAFFNNHCALFGCYWAIQRSFFARVNALRNLSRKKSREVAACLVVIGRFSEAFLLEWMPFVIFRARSRERSQRHFWVGVASRCVEVEPRIAKQYKCQYYCSCKNYRGKWMKGGKKVSAFFFFFFADQKIASSWKKCVLGHPIALATSYCLLPDTLWLRASKKAFKVGSEKFANSLSPPSIVKKVRTGSKSSQGT